MMLLRDVLKDGRCLVTTRCDEHHKGANRDDEHLSAPGDPDAARGRRAYWQREIARALDGRGAFSIDNHLIIPRRQPRQRQAGLVRAAVNWVATGSSGERDGQRPGLT